MGKHIVDTTDKEEMKKSEFRKYEENSHVSNHYKLNHTHQTLEFAHKIRSEILPVKKINLSIFDVISLMDEIYDPSDPDTESPQIIHALQTGESCRKAHPDKDWFHLLGFIHDLGKSSSHKNMYNLPQWAVTGDTFPVGCSFNKQIVYSEYFKENADSKHEIYSQKLGIYKENIGFDNIIFSWGHDEYLYQVLKANNCKLPEEALYTIRYHSFYPWHQNGAYDYLANEKDYKMLPLLKEFQKCDLYSKCEESLDVKELKKYYEKLIEKYFENPILNW